MSARDRPARATRPAAAILALGLALFLLADTRADPDLWGHVKFGHDILETRQVARADLYSYRSGEQPWVNHEWLAEAILAATFGLAGPGGLVLLKLGIAALVGAVLIAHLGGPGLGEAIALGGAFGLLWPWLGTVRPQLFTYLLFAVLLVILDRAGGARHSRLWAVPLLFAAWVNLHGGVLAGLAVLLLWSLVRAIGAWAPLPSAGPTRTRIALLALASLGATLLNPYGPGLLLFLLSTATVARPDITEWAPLDLASPFGLTYLAVLALCAVGLRYSRRDRDPLMLVLLACIATAPLLAVRHAPLFGVAAAALAGRHIADAWRTAVAGLAPSLASVRPALVFRRAAQPWRRVWPWALAVTGAVLAAVSLPSFGCVRVLAGDVPSGAVGVLDRSGARGNLAVHFDWGEYAIWRLAPRFKVSVDGRRETVYSAGALEENLRFMQGVGAWDSLLVKRDTQVALVKRDFPSYSLMKLVPGWSPVYEDAQSALFVRADSPDRAALERAAGAVAREPAPACFPGHGSP